MARTTLGQQIHAALVTEGVDAGMALAVQQGQPDLFARVHAVALAEPEPNFLHSALCAMSLPVRRPAEDSRSIIREDGNYTLVITPKPVLRRFEDRQEMISLGVPYGSLPRLILIHIMTEAVRNRSNHVVLGSTFADWMRRMGYQSFSYGKRGSGTLIREQLDRLLACEWMIKWERQDGDQIREYGVKEIKLTNDFGGVDRKGGKFDRDLRLTPAFFDHLREHAVPLNEHAIRQLRDSATALDLYTWLAYRLPRLNGKRPALLSWNQLAQHFGNSGNSMRKFRQTVRDAWERHVSAVYPEARAEFDTTVIRLYGSPAPLQRKLVFGEKLLEGPTVLAPPTSTSLSIPELFMASMRAQLSKVEFASWLGDAQLVTCAEEGWKLTTTTRFKASWLRSNQDLAFIRAAAAAGLQAAPRVCVRDD